MNTLCKFSKFVHALACIGGLTVSVAAHADDQYGGTALYDSVDKLSAITIPLENQDYALCAVAVTFNFNGVAYTKCEKKFGDSLALAHEYPGPPAGDAATVNALGNDEGTYMVSTYSPPDVSKHSVYRCEGMGSYAQCNGGLCFKDTSGKDFPGVGPVLDNEIICSCPIEQAKIYNVWGPSDCPTSRQKFDMICGKGPKSATAADGVRLHVGSDGPPITLIAYTELYNKVFEDEYELPKVCKRPHSGGSSGPPVIAVPTRPSRRLPELGDQGPGYE
ncbi:MAG: hypothetical protein FJX60_20505 [Alphaproteobacteria bacterium]|nr:hypothetical protein [Alphaproteobacteria bacterium]